MVKTQSIQYDLIAGAWLVLAGAWAVSGGENPGGNAAPLLLSGPVLLLGYSRGPLAAWLAGLCAGVFVTALSFAGLVSIQICLASLGALLTATLFPIPWVSRQEEAREAFEQRRQPLEQKRDFTREQLQRVEREVAVSEQRARETDALYHAGREISKLLTLEDTLEFSREIIRDTLLGTGSRAHTPASAPGGEEAGTQEPAFVLMLVEEDAGRIRVGTHSGMEAELAARFEGPLGAQDLMNWLRLQGKPLTLANAASEPRLKGVPIPPQVRGFSCVPLLIEEAVIGLVVIFDLGGARMDHMDSGNLRILATQVAIGIEKAALYDKVQRLSITDGLTGLFVHRHFQARLDEEMRRAERYKEPLSLIMLDIDFFKKYNDNYGHLAGDAVLKRVAALVKGNLESADFAARYGGEEFAAILPKQDRKTAAAKAEAIRKAVEADSFSFEGVTAKVTVSLGLACFPADAMTKKGLIDRADQALYKAKHDGRNRVEGA